jgi:L-fucose mutarotase
MLSGIDQLLTGELLLHLDAMGHSDAVVVTDAHFPADRLAQRLVVLPGLDAPRVLRAVRSVLPLDDAPALDLMATADGGQVPVQHELMAAAGVDEAGTRFIDRYAYYDLAEQAFLVIRTGETRPYGNALLRKGLVQDGPR